MTSPIYCWMVTIEDYMHHEKAKIKYYIHRENALIKGLGILKKVIDEGGSATTPEEIDREFSRLINPYAINNDIIQPDFLGLEIHIEIKKIPFEDEKK